MIGAFPRKQPVKKAGADAPAFSTVKEVSQSAHTGDTRIEVRSYLFDKLELAAVNRWILLFASHIFLPFLSYVHEAVPAPVSGCGRDSFDPYLQTRV